MKRIYKIVDRELRKTNKEWQSIPELATEGSHSRSQIWRVEGKGKEGCQNQTVRLWCTKGCLAGAVSFHREMSPFYDLARKNLSLLTVQPPAGFLHCPNSMRNQRIVDSKDLVLMMCVARSPAEEEVERRAERVEARGGVMGQILVILKGPWNPQPWI